MMGESNLEQKPRQMSQGLSGLWQRAPVQAKIGASPGANVAGSSGHLSSAGADVGMLGSLSPRQRNW